MDNSTKSHLAIDLDTLEAQLKNVHHQQPPRRPRNNDPLSELARIVGQDDPYRAILANERMAAPAEEPGSASARKRRHRARPLRRHAVDGPTHRRASSLRRCGERRSPTRAFGSRGGDGRRACQARDFGASAASGIRGNAARHTRRAPSAAVAIGPSRQSRRHAVCRQRCLRGAGRPVLRAGRSDRRRRGRLCGRGPARGGAAFAQRAGRDRGAARCRGHRGRRALLRPWVDCARAVGRTSGHHGREAAHQGAGQGSRRGGRSEQADLRDGEAAERPRSRARRWSTATASGRPR